MSTLDAHVVQALDARTGNVIWDMPMAGDSHAGLQQEGGCRCSGWATRSLTRASRTGRVRHRAGSWTRMTRRPATSTGVSTLIPGPDHPDSSILGRAIHRRTGGAHDVDYRLLRPGAESRATGGTGNRGAGLQRRGAH